MSLYNVILQDLFSENESDQQLQPPPYNEDMPMKEKIEITYNCFMRARRLKQRIPSLIFAYYLGQLIETRDWSKRQCKQIVSEYFYTIAIRVYYIFEVNPLQIYATKLTTIAMVRKLKQGEFKSLTLEL